ncbi:MFS transporter [Ktedonosporobacter rubrisoli]|uniref:MFS transporter n=1 Tax=Ktedonosporobacter rubrisoli TaxID=2509675 RepID=A0A4P6JVL4_KTERU|nr:MFS transporter [Ktedonosporobacter rubrisoli]QBD79709.1 MFS transporter [Ktedonosporobacter rubrisoli]
MTQTSSSQRPSSLWTNRNYLLLWIGQSFSLIGDYFFIATIAIWIIDRLAHGQPWLPLAAGAVPLLGAVPALLLAPPAGVFVDRWDRRRTMLWTDIVRTILVALFLLLTIFVNEPTWLLISSYATVLLCACGAQFFMPARVAVVNDIILPEQRPMAFGSLQQANYLAQIVGPALAAPLYILLGPVWAIALNALSYLVSFLVLVLLRVPAYQRDSTQSKTSFWVEFREGLNFFVTNRVLVTLLISGMIFMFAGMAFNSFEYLYGVENLHITNGLLGLYVGCYGIGVVIGLPITASLARRYSEVQILWIFLLGHGLMTIILSRMTSLIPGMICTLLIGFFSTAIYVTVRPLTMRVTPSRLIGRVMAFESPLITAASLIGGTLASVLASTVLQNLHATFAGFTFGRLDTIFFIVGLLVMCAGIFARLTLYREVKKLNAEDTVQQPSAAAVTE